MRRPATSARHGDVLVQPRDHAPLRRKGGKQGRHGRASVQKGVTLCAYRFPFSLFPVVFCLFSRVFNVEADARPCRMSKRDAKVKNRKTTRRLMQSDQHMIVFFSRHLFCRPFRTAATFRGHQYYVCFLAISTLGP